MRVRIERAYRSRAAELINDVTCTCVCVCVLVRLHVRACVRIRVRKTEQGNGGGPVELGGRDTRWRKEKQKYYDEVSGLVRSYRDTRCMRIFFFFLFSRRRKGHLYASMTLCQMEPHPEPGTDGLSDTLIFHLADVPSSSA